MVSAIEWRWIIGAAGSRVSVIFLLVYAYIILDVVLVTTYVTSFLDSRVVSAKSLCN